MADPSPDELAAILKQIETALAEGDFDTLQHLSETHQEVLAGASASMRRRPDGFDALETAIEAGDLETARTAAQGLDLNHPDLSDHDRPIIWALKYGTRTDAMLAMLMGTGADVGLVSGEGYTLLHHICDTYYGDTKVEELAKITQRLVAAGVPLEAANHYGWTPVMRAVIEGTEAELEALLLAGGKADVTFPPDAMPKFTRGLTVVMVAASDPRKVRLLLDFGADPMRTNAEGETAYDYIDRQLARYWDELEQKTERGEDTEFLPEFIKSLESSRDVITIHREHRH